MTRSSTSVLVVAVAAASSSPSALVERLTTGACRQASASYASGIAGCINLAVPFTGSRTLRNLLRLYGSPYAHHDHRITAALLAAHPAFTTASAQAPWLRQFPRGLAAPACVVVTVRDPAARVNSGVNNCRNGRNCLKGGGANCAEFSFWNRSAADVVDAYYDVENRAVTSDACFGLDRGPAAYLADVDCARVAPHFLCTDRLVADFRALLAAFGASDGALNASDADALRVSNADARPHQRQAYRDRVAAYYERALPPRTADAVRRRQRDDAALYARLCGSGAYS